MVAKIEEAITQLPEKCEMIFRLVREDGMCYKDVAELLDIAPKTVENQMHIALKKILNSDALQISLFSKYVDVNHGLKKKP